MKTIITLIFGIILALSSQISFGQDKLEQKATEMIKEMNSKLTEVTKLSLEQEKQLLQMYIDKMKEVSNTKKEVTDETIQKEKIKEINKNYGKKINETILNKEQKEVLKEYRKNHTEQYNSK